MDHSSIDEQDIKQDQCDKMMLHSDDDDASKPPADKKVKRDEADAAATVYSIIHGSFNYSVIDSFSFLVPTTDGERVLAALVQSAKQHHTWTIVPNEQMDAELVQKIPACLAHAVGTLPRQLSSSSSKENPTEEELLDLILTGRAGIIAKKYVILHIGDGKDRECKYLVPIEVTNNEQCMQLQQAAENLMDEDMGEWNYISHVSVWNQSEFKINLVGLCGHEDEEDMFHVVKKGLTFSNPLVTSLIDLGTAQFPPNVDTWAHYGKVHDLLGEMRD